LRIYKYMTFDVSRRHSTAPTVAVKNESNIVKVWNGAPNKIRAATKKHMVGQKYFVGGANMC